MLFKSSLQYDHQIHDKIKFWKSKKTSFIKNNNLIELMMYMARRCFHIKKDQSVEKYQTSTNNSEILQITLFIYRFTSNHLLYLFLTLNLFIYYLKKRGKRIVQGVPQSQTALPRHQKEEETDKSKQAKIEQTYEKH